MWMCCILLRELFPVLLVYGVLFLSVSQWQLLVLSWVVGVWCLLLPVGISIVVVCFFVSLFILQEISF